MRDRSQGGDQSRPLEPPIIKSAAQAVAAVEHVFDEPDHWQGQDSLRQLAEQYRCIPGFPGP